MRAARHFKGSGSLQYPKLFCIFFVNIPTLYIFADHFNKFGFQEFVNESVMKQDIHPKAYRLVVFKDMSNNTTFITRSTAASRENITIDGVEYPLIKLEISSTSHPYFTGKMKLVDTAGRVDKFMNRYKDHYDKKKK